MIKRKTSIFLKIFSATILIVIFSNLILAYTIYQGYKTVFSEAEQFLPREKVENIVVTISNTWIIVGSTIFFIILLTTLFVILFISNILGPLQKLMEAFSEVSKGNLDVKVDIQTKDEIEEMGKKFNLMVQDLKNSREALEDEKKVLEIKVKARTRELEELNKILELKIQERTQELANRIEELESFHRLTVERELKMIELKKEIEKLKQLLEEKKEEK